MKKKRIVFIYRSRAKNGHSIENVFKTIESGLSLKNYEVITYFLEKPLLTAIHELRKIDADYYHITGDIYFLAIFLPRSKTTLTVHDIGFYKNHKKTFKIKLKGLLWLVLPLNYVKNFSVISDLVKQDVINYFNISSKKISIIPNPLTLSLSNSKKEINLEKIKILQIGTGEHKNLIGLIEAVKLKKNLHIEIVGNPSIDLINLMNVNDISYTLYKNISNKKVTEIYSNIDIVYFASFSEGFGLPILEGQASGKIVITSNISPMKEVAGDGAILVDPHNFEEINEAIENAIYNSELRENIINKGFNNLKRYELNNIASKYIDFFEKK